MATLVKMLPGPS